MGPSATFSLGWVDGVHIIDREGGLGGGGDYLKPSAKLRKSNGMPCSSKCGVMYRANF